ncbi:unnamed protein product [Pieris macdunnoughi]|uniref:Uncharacterized protein n=1 Tax=Pieris macdunnoughi TaxID=345717 RepID=A0A821R0C0_9NEOP|nr:unnamed protein product [Pieris macdunnoughi]
MQFHVVLMGSAKIKWPLRNSRLVFDALVNKRASLTGLTLNGKCAWSFAEEKYAIDASGVRAPDNGHREPNKWFNVVRGMIMFTDFTCHATQRHCYLTPFVAPLSNPNISKSACRTRVKITIHPVPSNRCKSVP